MDELFKEYYEEQKMLEAAKKNCKTCEEENNYEHPEYCERCIGCDRWKPKYTELLRQKQLIIKIEYI